MDLPRLTDLEVAGKKVIVRLDLDTEAIAGKPRIKYSEETLDYLKDKNSKIIIIAHKGRPEGRVDEALSLMPFKPIFEKWGADLMENLRFDEGEEENNPEFAKKIAEQEKFEQDLRSFESQLGLSVTAGSFPAASSGILDWPLDSVRITQYFGNTDFSTKNPQIYNGRGHTGMDFAASSGTRILSARGGIVLGTGNTDATCPNASYGKWVFIKHDNGLSTLYAHLSSISVSGGQSIGAGELVGYSGNTGYSTGPHLHFGVYATSGSEIASFPSSSCRGKTYTMPVGDTKAYLNPLSYLPAR